VYEINSKIFFLSRLFFWEGAVVLGMFSLGRRVLSGGHLRLESFLHLGKYGINDREMTHIYLLLKSVTLVAVLAIYCKIFFMLGLRLSHRILVHIYWFLIKLLN
jgi:hypothetical protein